MVGVSPRRGPAPEIRVAMQTVDLALILTCACFVQRSYTLLFPTSVGCWLESIVRCSRACWLKLAILYTLFLFNYLYIYLTM